MFNFLFKTFSPKSKRTRWHGPRHALVIACGIIPASNDVNADDLYLRGSDTKTIGSTIEINAGGILFRPAREDQTFYTWDQVRRLDSDAPAHNEKFAEYRDLAEDLWRARSRVERLDYELAEPLFEKYFPAIIGRTDPTALVVAEGLLRCRVARHARAEAIIPWLETWRMRSAGIEINAYANLPRVLDQNGGLCPDLPPVWVREEEHLPTLVRDLSVYRAPGNEMIRTMAELYEYAARVALEEARERSPLDLGDADSTQSDATSSAETDEKNGGIQESTNGSSSVLLVRSFLVATLPDVEGSDRERAVRMLGRWTRSSAWPGAWSHYARGIARIDSSNEEERRRGLVDLLLLPSEYVEVDPYLAGLALFRAIPVVEALGQPEAAASLKHEFDLRFSDHPIHPRVAPRFGESSRRVDESANPSESS